MATDNGFWLMPVVFGALAMTRLIALGSKARMSRGKLVFTATVLHRAIIVLGTAGCFAVLASTWRASQVWERTVLCLIGIGIACGWPAAVILDDEGLRRKSWWSRGVFIPWRDVTSIEKNGAGEYEVYGQGSGVLTFSRFLIDPERFRNELLTRTQLKMRNVSDVLSVTPR